jgi:hypothetical protein
VWQEGPITSIHARPKEIEGGQADDVGLSVRFARPDKRYPVDIS